MSQNKRLIINCGATHLTAALFTLDDGRLTIEEFAIQPIEYDYSIEEDWMGALGGALKKLTAQARFRGPAHVIAPGYLLLTKAIKVPHVDASKQTQIIAFEAQNNIPYPLHEVVWDSQTIADDGVETEVILIAMKSDMARDFCAILSRHGILPEVVQASSILDYNAHFLTGSSMGQDTLLINIGARSTNLLFINQGGFFVRNIALGGNALTQSLADNLGKGFIQAESIKVNFFSGQSDYTADDPTVQILQSNAQAFMKRMSQEITRSIVNYRRQNQGKPPARIMLTGRASLLPGLSEHLSETQRMSVDYFNPTKGLALGKNVEREVIEKHIYDLSEVIGEAVHMTPGKHVGINLLPDHIRRRQIFSRRRPYLVAAMLCLAVSPVFPALYFNAAAGAYRSENHALAQRIPQLRALAAEMEDNAATAQDIRDRMGKIEGLVNSRANWNNFFSDLQTRLAGVKDVWLEDLKVVREPPRSGSAQPTYQLQLSGRLLLRNPTPESFVPDAQRRIRRLITDFTQSEFIVREEGYSLDTRNPRILRFNFTLVVNPEKPL